MTPRRWGINTRLWAYRYLVLRDGEQCARCYEIPTTQNTLDIDHIDGNPRNNDPDNLRLLCRSCNVALSNKSRRPPSDQYVCVEERERKEGKAATRVVREVVDYQQGDPPMQANFLFEVDFRNWLLTKVLEKGGYPADDAINAGAEVVGCSPVSTKRYLAKLTSDEGPLTLTRDMLKRSILVLKDHLRPAEALFHVELDQRLPQELRRGSGHQDQAE